MKENEVIRLNIREYIGHLMPLILGIGETKHD